MPNTDEITNPDLPVVEEPRPMYPDLEFKKKYEPVLKDLAARSLRGEIIMPNKHLAYLKSSCAVKLAQTRRSSPQTPLSVALADAIRPINPHTTPEMLLELTRHLIKEWMKMEVAEKPGTATEPAPKSTRKKPQTTHN